MDREMELDYAISATLKEHPEFVPYVSNIIYKNIYNGTNPVNFTASARDYINSARQVDFIHYILEETLVIYASAQQLLEDDLDEMETKNLSKHFVKMPVIMRAVDIIKDKDNNSILYYLYNRSELFELIDAVCKTIFKKPWYSDNGITNDIRTNFHQLLKNAANDNKEYQTLRRFLSKEVNARAVKKVKNLYINYEAINICRREIMLGNQVRHNHNEYSLGDCLYATQDVGKKRANQEDSVLILEHETNPNFKLLAVADGMGGHAAGEVASTFVLERLSNWFNTLDYTMYEHPEQVQIMLTEELRKISKELYKYLGSKKKFLVGGTTFTGAIVTEEKTVIASVGDSRAYILHNDELDLITKDESAVWEELAERKARRGEVPTKEDIDNLRFMDGNNLITRCMGQEDLEYVQSYVINNDSYDQLLLFTDGITDLLSQDDINFICTSTFPEDLTRKLVSSAMNQSITEKLRGSDKEVELVSAGKDNATAVAYFRR